MDCMMGRMFPSSPPSPPSSNPRPSRVLTRSSPASPVDCKKQRWTYPVRKLFHSCIKKFQNNSDFTYLQVVCIFGQATEGFFKTGCEFLLGGCVSAYIEYTELSLHEQMVSRGTYDKYIHNTKCRSYQLCLQPLTICESAAVTLVPPGPAHSWPFPTPPWLEQPFPPQRESRKACSPQGGVATQVNRKHVSAL